MLMQRACSACAAHAVRMGGAVGVETERVEGQAGEGRKAFARGLVADTDDTKGHARRYPEMPRMRSVCSPRPSCNSDFRRLSQREH